MLGPEQKLMDHDYDGIREYDNPMPGWWKLIFLGTIAFALAYWLYYGFVETDASVFDQYARDMVEQQELNARRAAAEMTEAKLQALAGDAALIAKGHEKFKTVCAACHGQKGEGLIGPNLTDNTWLHGGNLIDIYRTVVDGVPAKGMPTWGKMLPQDELQALVVYIGTLRNTNVPGKPPQGQPFQASTLGSLTP